MRKFLSLLVALATVTMAWAAQKGTLTSSKTPIDPTETVTLTYDGTGTNFANWEPSCFIHTWLVAADGQTLSKSYSTDWASCNGDGDYASLASKLKMTYSGTKGKYTISMNIKEFFNVADADLPKIGKLGVIVRAQYEGEDNKTDNMFVNVAYTTPASKVTYTALTKAPTTGNWAGQYLIVFADNKAHATVSGSDLAATSDALTIDEGEIEINSTDQYYVTVELMQGGYSIKLPNGKYLSVNANNNAVAAVNSAYPFNFEYTESGVKIFGKDTKGNVRYIMNQGTDYYRGYKWDDSYKLPTLYRTGDEAPALQTLYFVNVPVWGTVNAFVWPETGDAYKDWPGEAAIKTSEKALEKDIYAYTFPATYANILFNGGSEQTVDLTWTAAKPYFVPGNKNGEEKYEGTWYASKEDIPVPCQDGPYSILVNGTDTLKSIPGEEFDGYKQYVVYASLTKGDSIQLLNESCGALWMPNIEEGGAKAHFKKGIAAATVDSTGCFDLYIKMKMGDDKVYIGYGICPGDTVPPCLDGPYAIVVNGTDTIPANALTGEQEYDGEGRKQYVAYLSLNKGDSINVVNTSCEAAFLPAIEEFGAYKNFTVANGAAKVDSTGCYDFYLKLKAEDDKVYIGYGICEGDSVVPCLDGPYGLIVNGTDTLRAIADGKDYQARNQYKVDSVQLEVGDKLVVANLSCYSKWVMDIEEGGASANFVKGTNEYTVSVAGLYVFYIKMSMESGDLMYIAELKPIEPVVTKDIYLVPRKWNQADALIAAWAWKEGQEGTWSVFTGEGDTLKAQIDEKADSIIFVRFANDVTIPDWNANIWNRTGNEMIDKVGMTYTITKWAKGQWDAVEMVTLTLILEGGQWPTGGIPKPQAAPEPYNAPAALGFKVAAWFWDDDENEGEWSDWFEEDSNGQLIVSIPAYAKHVIFVKFPLTATTPSWDAVTSADQIYAGEIQDTYTYIVKDNKGQWANHEYGIMVGTQFIAAVENTGQTEFLEFMLLGADLTSGQTFTIYDNTLGAGWVITKWSEGSYQFTVNSSNQYVVSATGKYDIYLKFYGPGNDEIYVAKQETTGCENINGVDMELRKVIENGNMYIYFNGRKYNVQGKLVY